MKKVRGFLILNKKFLFSQKSKAFGYNFGPDRFSCFDVYWKQTDRQAKYIYRSQKPN